MTEADKPAFIQLLTQVASFYKDEITKFAVSIWWSACQRYTLDELGDAFTQHASNPKGGQFMPKPADIIGALQGKPADRAQAAWGAAIGAASTVGAYSDVVFDDPSIHAAIADLGGWVTFCRTESHELPHSQRRFLQAYTAHAEVPGRAYPAKLLGAASDDGMWAIRGMDRPAPRLIGDPARARLVYQKGDGHGPRATQVNQALPVPDALKDIYSKAQQIEGKAHERLNPPADQSPAAGA